MGLLLAGLAAFFGWHLAPTIPGFRASLIARMGLTGYRVVHSIASVLALWLLIAGFGAARADPNNIVLWNPPTWTRHMAYVAMLPAFILLAASVIPSRIRTRTRQPILIAVFIWSLAHLSANGDVAGALLFGAFLLWAVFDIFSLARRGEGNLFGMRTGGWRGDIAAIVLGGAAWALMLFGGHRLLIGLPLLG